MHPNSFAEFRRWALWGSQLGGATFLVIWAYLTGTLVFVDTYWASKMLALSLVMYVVTFVLGVVSLPRWQGFVALAICACGTYWYTTPAYALGCN